MPAYPVATDYAQQAVERNTRWAERCLSQGRSDQAILSIVQEVWIRHCGGPSLSRWISQGMGLEG